MVASGLVAGGARKPGGRAGKRKARGRGGAGGLGARGGSRAGVGAGPAGSGVLGRGRGRSRSGGAGAEGAGAGTLQERGNRPRERRCCRYHRCLRSSLGVRAALCSVADHVENNNSLVWSQRQLVLLGAPSSASGFPGSASRAPPSPPPSAPDRARACGAAEKRPAPGKGSTKGNGGVHPRLREREWRGAPGLEANSAGPGGGRAARSFAAGSQECAAAT
ncbi:pupal cuticle protein 36-like [Herpailurus yagouaroundi]|uniref:pupal cuticle protein 36-like n=1 Tax=Herpailurus yagouaroundi TaxID=1608482 RepID=UPI001AD7A24E|nr:pupal cuticle protein 36-like [Puma yagouaroundi]